MCVVSALRVLWAALAPSPHSLRRSRRRHRPGRPSWMGSGKASFLLPVKVLSRVFRGKFVAGLRRAFRRHQLHFGGSLKHLADPKRSAAFLRTLFRTDWVVMPNRRSAAQRRCSAISAGTPIEWRSPIHRLLAFERRNVTFRWRDYARGNRQRKMTVSAEEFIPPSSDACAAPRLRAHPQLRFSCQRASRRLFRSARTPPHAVAAGDFCDHRVI